MPVSARIQFLADVPLPKRTLVSIDMSTFYVFLNENGRPELLAKLAPHEAQYINALIEAKVNGNVYVTETELRLLPGCKGRNVTRDFNGSKGARSVKGIKQKYPKLWNLIEADSQGRYLRV